MINDLYIQLKIGLNDKNILAGAFEFSLKINNLNIKLIKRNLNWSEYVQLISSNGLCPPEAISSFNFKF